MTLRLSLREVRLILERLVQAAGVPPGVLPAVRDCALLSALAPGPGLAGIAPQLELLGPPRPMALDGDVLGHDVLGHDVLGGEALDGDVLDGGGNHAWLVAHAVLDILRAGRTQLRVVEVTAPAELRVIAGLAATHGLAVTLAPVADGTIVTATASPAADPFARLAREGLPADPALWWPLYHASHAALATDSVASRRHAGTVRVEADGTVTGRGDEDETDLAMLTEETRRC